MSKDFSIRLPATEKRLKLLASKNLSQKRLSKIKDTFFKPININLSDYHPQNICLRLREFLEENSPATLVEFKFTQTPAGYTDKRNIIGEGQAPMLFQKAQKLGYAQWGETLTVSTEYKLKLDEEDVTVLFQNIKPLGNFLKIETQNSSALTKAINFLSVSSEEIINKNSAVLLAEKTYETSK